MNKAPHSSQDEAPSNRGGYESAQQPPQKLMTNNPQNKVMVPRGQRSMQILENASSGLINANPYASSNHQQDNSNTNISGMNGYSGFDDGVDGSQGNLAGAYRGGSQANTASRVTNAIG